MRVSLLFFPIFFTLISCVEPFDTNKIFEDQGGIPVINGWISNFPHDYRIYVSRTVALDDLTPIKSVSDAIVILKNGSGESFETFYDSKEKNYSFPDLFTGKEGETYWIEVTFSDGMVFQSSPEQLQSATPIQDLTLGKKIEFNESLNLDLSEVIVHFTDPPDKRNYYLWLTTNLFHGSRRPDSRLYTIENDLTFNGQSRSVFVNEAGGFPLLVRQFSISRTGYKFFDLLNQLNEAQDFNLQNTGESENLVDPIGNGLFAKPLISLEGNIFERGNELNFGAGYFGVYAQHSMALRSEEPEYTLELNPIFTNICKIRRANGVIVPEPGFEYCISFPKETAIKEGNWQSYVFQEYLDVSFHSTYFIDNLFTQVTLRSNSVHVKLESRSHKIQFPEGERFVDHLYLLIEDGFSGEVNLEIEATDFFTTKTARYILNVE